MKKKNKKEIVILSLIFIAIIACIILLIVLKKPKKAETTQDEFYLSQESVMYVSDFPTKTPFNEIGGSISSYYSIYKDGTVYRTDYRYSSDIEYDSFKRSFFVKKLSESEMEILKAELIALGNSSYSSTDSPSLKDWNNSYYSFKVNGTMYYAKNYNVYLNVLAKYVNSHDFISSQISNYVYNYIKNEYLPSHPYINISDVDNKTILSVVKNKYPDSGCSDAELFDIINIQITSILVEQLEQGN